MRYPLFLVVLILGLTRALVAEEQEQAFLSPSPERRLSFPRDHGAHPGFQTEWWYFTGQLWEEGKRPFRDAPRFGYQLTFFRREQVPGQTQGFLAHVALGDFKSHLFQYGRRHAGALLGLAGADESYLRVWNRDWSADLVGQSLALIFSLESESGGNGARGVDASERRDNGPDPLFETSATTVRLIAPKIATPWLHGEGGVSRKGACLHCASHYYSFPHLSTVGDIKLSAEPIPVHGVSWMDHEFMSHALLPDQVGWDWFSIMLADGSSLMLFEVRGRTPQSSFRSGSLLKEGRNIQLNADDFEIAVLEHWKSPHSGARYPAQWRVRVPSHKIDLLLRPRMADQELYWEENPESEGAPRAYYEGAIASGDEQALGYVEMTGYDRPIGDLL